MADGELVHIQMNSQLTNCGILMMKYHDKEFSLMTVYVGCEAAAAAFV